MSRALHFASAPTTATLRAALTPAPLPTTLLLTIGSLPLPFMDQCTG
jgi:hypothetical protein